MQQLTTTILRPDAGGIAHAAELLTNGALVAFPTETVYGLGADARNDYAVARVFEAKGRPDFNPLIVHVASIEIAKRFVEWSTTADILAQAFWPGPLTLVLPLKADAGLSKLVTAGLDTLAIRVPDHPVAQALLTAFNGPVAAPSANPSGRISPTTAEHVQSGLGGRIDAIVDGGQSSVGLESTIIGLTEEPTVLRPGGLPNEAVEAALNQSLRHFLSSDTISAPGQMTSHYAPGVAVRLNVEQPDSNELFLGFGAVDCDLNLSPSGDLIEAAANLFRYLHMLDVQDAKSIAVSPIPDRGIGRAINDRLKRAAAPRT